MALLIEMPDEVVQALRPPAAEMQAELTKELAIILYARGALSLGKSVEMAGVRRQEFEAILAKRKIERPYDLAEVLHDTAWGND